MVQSSGPQNKAVQIPNKDISKSNLKPPVKAVASVIVAGIFKGQKGIVDEFTGGNNAKKMATPTIQIYVSANYWL